MSMTFTLTDRSSVLSFNFNPPIYLDEDPSVEYEIGLANFDAFNLIPNIDKNNNVFVWGEKDEYRIEIPVGSYELKDLIDLLLKEVSQRDDEVLIRITPNLHTAKIAIATNRRINFQVNNSLGSVLGFKDRILPANDTQLGDVEIEILKINTICIDCNIAMGSYLNGKPVHVIHQFAISSPYGYKLTESPLTILYFPVSVKTINNITVRIVDQRGNLIDFRGEEITIRLHLRKKL